MTGYSIKGAARPAKVTGQRRAYHGEEARRVAMNRLGAEKVCVTCGGDVDMWQLAKPRGPDSPFDDPLCSKCFERLMDEYTIASKAYVREQKAKERGGWREDRRRRSARR